MGIVAGLAGAAAAASLGSTIYGAVSGNSGTGGYYGGTSPPPVYIPQGQGTADTQYQGLATNMYNLANQQQNNPYAAQALQGANVASGYGVNTLAPAQAASAANLYGAGNQVYNTAFDPRMALYNQEQQRTLDQANAINAMYGLSSSPYGAGVANQALTNFNLDWQNQQLARQLQGIQGAGQAYSGATDLGTGAASTYQTAYGLPYQTYTGQLSTTQGLDSNTLNALAAYLRLGQSATATGQAGANINFGQNQALGQAAAGFLGNPSVQSGLSSLFGGGGMSQGAAADYITANAPTAFSGGVYV